MHRVNLTSQTTIKLQTQHCRGRVWTLELSFWDSSTDQQEHNLYIIRTTTSAVWNRAAVCRQQMVQLKRPVALRNQRCVAKVGCERAMQLTRIRMVNTPAACKHRPLSVAVKLFSSLLKAVYLQIAKFRNYIKRALHLCSLLLAA